MEKENKTQEKKPLLESYNRLFGKMDSFDRLGIKKGKLNETIQVGKQYELDLDGYSARMFDMDIDEFDVFKRYNGQPVKVTQMHPGDGEDDYYDIETRDGKSFGEISGWHLKPIGWSKGK
jgi:hypothetical protein